MTDSSDLLKPVSSFSVDGVEEFSVAERFQTSETVDGVQIAYLGRTFRNRFANVTETGVGPVTIAVRDLQKEASDLEIIIEISDEEIPGISLAHFHSLLKNQGAGQEDGLLLTNGDTNICHIRHPSGRLYLVNASFHADGNSQTGGWYLYTPSDLQETDRREGHRVFSRVSS